MTIIAILLIPLILCGAFILTVRSRATSHPMSPRLIKFMWFVAIATIYGVVYFVLFGWAFALGDAGVKSPAALSIAVEVLGMPMMLLLRVPPEVLAPHGRWWGDDSNFILGLILLNSMFWSLVISLALHYWKRRNNHFAAAPTL